MVLVLSSNVAAWQDRLDDAIKLARRAVTLDPLASVPRNHFANLLLASGNFEEAKAQFIKQFELSTAGTPETDPAIGFILVLERRFDEATNLIEYWPSGGDRDQVIPLIGAAIGRAAEADAAIRKLSASPLLGDAVRLAEVHAFCGETEEAFIALEAARSRITTAIWSSPDGIWIWQLRFSPFLRPLHSHARWLRLRPAQPPFTTAAAR
jgi:tetratricopeptide (TPR) repeat protein